MRAGAVETTKESAFVPQQHILSSYLVFHISSIKVVMLFFIHARGRKKNKRIDDSVLWVGNGTGRVQLEYT